MEFCYRLAYLTLNTYWSLHHQHSLFPQVAHKLVNVDGVLLLDPLQHVVQGDEGACPAHPSTAVHQQQVLSGVRVSLPHSLDEVDHGDGIGGHPMIRPGHVVVLGHLQGRCVWLTTLKWKQVEREVVNYYFYLATGTITTYYG